MSGLLVESPRATGAARRSPTAILTRRPAHRRAAVTNRRRQVFPDAARDAALAAGGVLTVTGRGDLWTLAIAFGIADASLLTALTVAAGGVATLARTGSAALVDIHGSQAVLGAAGFTGSSMAVAATWATALGLVTAGRRPAVGAGLGLVAGALVAGPALNGGTKSVAVWILGAVVGASIGWIVAPRTDDARRWQPFVALAFVAAAVALGVLAGYH